MPDCVSDAGFSGEPSAKGTRSPGFGSVLKKARVFALEDLIKDQVAPNAGERVIGKPKLQSLGVKFRDKLDDIEDPNFRCDNDSRRFVALVPFAESRFRQLRYW